jgi:hypothetical protein
MTHKAYKEQNDAKRDRGPTTLLVEDHEVSRPCGLL